MSVKLTKYQTEFTKIIHNLPAKIYVHSQPNDEHANRCQGATPTSQELSRPSAPVFYSEKIGVKMKSHNKEKTVTS